MNKYLFLLLSYCFINCSISQNCSDSLRLVLPVGQSEELISYTEFSPNGNFMLSLSANKVVIWDKISGKELNSISFDEDIISARFSLNSKELILITTKSIRILNLLNLKDEKYKLIIDSEIFKELNDNNRDTVIVLTKQNEIVLLDLIKKEKKSLNLDFINASKIKDVCFNSISMHLALINDDNFLIIYDLYSESTIYKNKIESEYIKVIFGNSKNEIVLWSEIKNFDIKILNYLDKKFDLIKIKGKISNLTYSLSNNRSYLIFHLEQNYLGYIQICDISKKKKVKILKKLQNEFIPSTGINCLLYDKNLNKIIFGDRWGFLNILDSQTGRLVYKHGIADEIYTLNIDKNIKDICGGTKDGVSFIFRLDKNVLKILKGHTQIQKTSFDDYNIPFTLLKKDSLTIYKNTLSREIKFKFSSPSYFVNRYFASYQRISDVYMYKNYLVFYDPMNLYEFPIYIRSIINNKMLYELKGHKEEIIFTKITDDKLISISSDLNIRWWDLDNGNCTSSKYINKEDTEQVKDIQVSDDQKYILISFLNKEYIYLCNLKSLNLETKKISYDIYNKDIITCFNLNTNDFFTLLNNNKLIFWSNKTLKKINEYDLLLPEKVNKLICSYNQSLFFQSDNFIFEYNIFNNKLNFIHENKICDVNINKNNNNLLLNTNEYKSIFIDLQTFDKKFENYQFDQENWLIKLSNKPYYMCSKDASKILHYVTPSLKVIGFEQLDPIYNRPDIVLDSIGKYFGNTDKDMIDEYRKSWEKRIDRLGLDKEKLGKGEIAVPYAEIIEADKIAYENKEGNLSISIKANDPKYKLKRFNVFVNEVPLYGSVGISIAHLKKQQWDTTLSVPLSIGENKIQVSVMNELGLESFKYPSYVNYTPSKQLISKTHFIGIGVNNFMDSKKILSFCTNDIKKLADRLNSQRHVNLKILKNKEVTRENILKLKDYLKDSTTVNDKVIISCSSHGLLDDSLNFYLATYDVDFNNPKQRGLKYEELEDLLDSIPARQKLLLLDACNSGENDRIEYTIKKGTETELKSHEIASRGPQNIENVNNSTFIKMNELFVNVRNNTGSVIISAAGGRQSALEGEAVLVDGKPIENGAFTYCVLEFFDKNKDTPENLTVTKLKQYVENRVEEITNGRQKPTSRQETMEVDWKLK